MEHNNVIKIHQEQLNNIQLNRNKYRKNVWQLDL